MDRIPRGAFRIEEASHILPLKALLAFRAKGLLPFNTHMRIRNVVEWAVLT